MKGQGLKGSGRVEGRREEGRLDWRVWTTAGATRVHRTCLPEGARQSAGMVRVLIDYKGELHCQVTHESSGAVFQTDAPKDNQGRGASFSPTDLVATALGSCMATTMGIVGRRHDIQLDGVHVTVDKEMTAEGPRRIGRLTVHVHFPFGRASDPGQILEETALGCPVCLSISEGIVKEVHFHWEEA